MRSRTQSIYMLKILAIACATLVLFACQEQFDDEQEPSLSELIAIGKAYLVDGNGASAADAFNSARKIDAANTDAQFGLMLANIMQFTNLVDQIAITIGEIDLGQSYDPDQAVSIQAKSDELGDILHDFFSDSMATQISQNELLYFDLISRGDFHFQLDRYVLDISGMMLVDFAGEFDKADAHFIGALNAMIDALIKFLLAHNLNFDIGVLSLPETNEGADLMETIGPYIDLIEDLLSSSDYPEFLMLIEDGGVEYMQQAGIGFGNVFTRLYLCFEQMAKENDPQEDDQIRFEDTNNNGYYNEQTDTVLIGKALALSPSEAAGVKDFFGNMATVFYDGSLLDTNTGIPNPLTPASFNELLTGFGELPIPVGDPAAPWFYIDELPAWPGIEVGYFFAYPEPDGLRSLLLGIIDLWNIIEPML